jgi:Arc/MetJ family transcription regulator
LTKTLLDVDDELLLEARRLLGTRSKKDTVNVALREVVERHRRASAFDRLRGMEFLADMADPEDRRSAWRANG